MITIFKRHCCKYAASSSFSRQLLMNFDKYLRLIQNQNENLNVDQMTSSCSSSLFYELHREQLLHIKISNLQDLSPIHQIINLYQQRYCGNSDGNRINFTPVNLCYNCRKGVQFYNRKILQHLKDQTFNDATLFQDAHSVYIWKIFLNSNVLLNRIDCKDYDNRSRLLKLDVHNVWS